MKSVPTPKSHPPQTIDFVVVGSRKCATTWLYELFLCHEETCVSHLVKQTGFFTKYYSRGEQWYFNLFSNPNFNQILGEVDPDILTTYGGIERVKEFAPEAKIIAIFRNPADLFYSSYEHSKRKGDLNCSPETAWKEHPSFQEELKFGTMADSIYQLFNKEQVLILCYEDIVECPEDVLHTIASFLNISPSFEPNLINKRVNPSRVARIPLLTKLLTRGARIARSLGLHALVKSAKRFMGSSESVIKRKQVDLRRSGELRIKILEAMSSEIKLFEARTGINSHTWFEENK